MNGPNLFMGGCSLLLGVLLVIGSATNGDWFLRSQRVQWLTDNLGRGGARCALLLFGLSLMALGVALAMGVSILE